MKRPSRPVGRAGLVAAGGVVVAGGVLLAVHLPVQPPADRLGACLWDGLHLPFTAIVAGAGALVARHLTGRQPRPWHLLAGGAGLAAAAELAQPLVGRTDSLRDAFFGVCGGALAAAILAAARSAGARRRTAGVTAALLLGAAAIPPALILVDRTAARRDFPLLAGFENRLEMSRWEFRDCAGRRIADSADDGRRVLEVTVTRTADFPMLALADGLGDWAGYRALTFVAWVPGGQPIELHARLDLPGERLRTQRRCRTSVPLSPGTNHVELPLSDWIRAASPATPLRPRRLTLYLRHGTAGTRFRLDDLRLVP